MAAPGRCRELLSLWIRRFPNPLRGFREIVGGMPEFNARSQQEPVGAWFPKRHPHTACIHHSSASDHTVELHVGMPADHYRCVDSFEDRQEALFRRQASETLIFVSRRG